MSRQKTTQVTEIANEAIDQLECASCQVSWANAIAWAIGQALDKGYTEHARRLAGVSQYLSDDYKFQLESETESLGESMGALGLRV